ncbi:hypothetical protein [Brucella grignonensis]|uniref:Uncharacterized protein n=1 Tax=Brucella grignonensis TaxID=94627 RepID=A0A256EZ35_9HYPH|nr:hypothetical protein [Brucella grignonensis]NKB84494.1 hypothetical protein [Brucella grignonensis]OYR07783.1 hypothetical protein CEV33_3564 [Brucella grignonensis]
MRNKSVAALLSLPLIITSSLALADDTQLLFNSSRNQLGLIKFCVAEGHISNDVVAAYEKIVKMLPTPADAAQGDQYESAGEQGYSFDGENRTSMQDIADGTGTSVVDHCTQFTALTNQ